MSRPSRRLLHRPAKPGRATFPTQQQPFAYGMWNNHTAKVRCSAGIETTNTVELQPRRICAKGSQARFPTQATWTDRVSLEWVQLLRFQKPSLGGAILHALTGRP
jgi:hypothetical protein